MEIDRTSHSYLLGQTEYRLKACQDENARLQMEIKRLQAELNQAPDELLAHDNSQLRGEVERLRADFNDCNTERARWRAEAKRLKALGNLDPSEMQKEIDRLRDIEVKYNDLVGLTER